MLVQAIKQEQDKKEKVSAISKVVLRSILVASIVFFLIVVIFTLFCKTDTSRNKDGDVNSPLISAYVIVSESMIPTIKVNDAIVITRVNKGSLKVGDIITFRSNDRIYKGMTVTHRIIGIDKDIKGEDIYRTKGDNNYLADTALVDSGSIYGKVILKIPKIGYLQRFVSSTAGFVISIILPIIVVILYEVIRIKKLIKKQDEEIEII